MKLRAYLRPILLGLTGTGLILRVWFLDTPVLLPENTDVMLLTVLLVIGIVVAIQAIVQLSMSYLRSLSVQRVRSETLAEHRRFLGRLDHELKNPVTAIRAGLKTLLMTRLDEQQEQIVVAMEAEILQLTRLVTDLRKLTELETQALEIQTINVEAFFSNLGQSERHRFNTVQRQFEYQIHLQRATWRVDEDLLALAVQNLLDNALKYTQPGDYVRLEVEDSQELLIRVTDTGPGIATEELPYIWDELYRAKQIIKVPGSGIGLALVKAIVERHQGSVQVSSVPGTGTTFIISFPYVSQI